MTSQIFKVVGFSDIQTGNRDYSMGVVRLDPTFLTGNDLARKWRRHDLLQISHVDHRGQVQTIYAMLRSIDPAAMAASNYPILALEYDDRLGLGIEKGQTAELTLSKAGLWGRIMYFRNHPNILIRTYAQYTFLTGVLFSLIGAMFWMVMRKLG